MKFMACIIAFVLFSAACLRCFGQQSLPPLKISHLTGNFYEYTGYSMLNGTPFPSNSMYLVTDKGVVMFDTPWDSTQFQPLLDSIKARHHADVVLCIATHFHADRTAGLAFLKARGVKTFTSLATYNLCKERGEKQAEFYFTKDTVFNIGGYSFQTYYPGKGHTSDNIVIWFEKQKILYGGCFIKSIETQDIGNIADADVVAWPVSVKKVMQKFPNARYVIPGHFGGTGPDALQHTLQLAQQSQKGQLIHRKPIL